LGLDNAFDGVRIKLRPIKGIELKGLIGKQRYYWSTGDGIVRGGDLNMTLGDLFGPILPGGYDLTLGGSVVSKFQQSIIYPFTNLPNNVLSWSARAGVTGESVNADIEYSHKINDPNGTNKFNFNPGYGLIINTSLFGSGYGFSLNLHKIDNMDFRSDRTARGNDLLINFIPPITKQTTYRLMTIYPYSTKLNGEAGLQADFTYTIPKNSIFGGEYGTTVNLNYSRVQSIDTTNTLMDTVSHKALLYKSPFFGSKSSFFGIGKRLFFQAFNVEITHKFSSSFKALISLLNTIYDKDIMENEGSPLYGKVYSNALVAELTFKLSDKNALRTEIQHLWATQDSSVQVPDNTNGNWVMGLVEYTIAPKWYFTVFSEYNYGNATADRKINYLSASISYVKEGFRIQAGWGRQRSGILCVGGVCRTVPASNGPSLSITTTF
jgi:hypothetical protein